MLTAVDQLNLDGAGQNHCHRRCLRSPNIASDLKTFDQTFGLPDPPSFIKVDQTGGRRYPRVDTGWAGEISLDVEWAHAIAPGRISSSWKRIPPRSQTWPTAVDFAGTSVAWSLSP